MPESISWEIREDAKELYVTEGMTYDQVASATGVSVAQLKRWGQDESWSDARKEYREAYTSIKRNTLKLRAGLLQKALDTKDPQVVYAFAWLERSLIGKKTPQPSISVNAKDISTPAQAVEALQDVVKNKLNAMLSQPETMQLSQVKDIKQTMELIDNMKAKYSPEAEKGENTLDAKSIKDIREMLKL